MQVTELFSFEDLHLKRSPLNAASDLLAQLPAYISEHCCSSYPNLAKQSLRSLSILLKISRLYIIDYLREILQCKQATKQNLKD